MESSAIIARSGGKREESRGIGSVGTGGGDEGLFFGFVDSSRYLLTYLLLPSTFNVFKRRNSGSHRRTTWFVRPTRLIFPFACRPTDIPTSFLAGLFPRLLPDLLDDGSSGVLGFRRSPLRREPVLLASLLPRLLFVSVSKLITAFRFTATCSS